MYLYLCICIYALLFGKNLVCIAYTAPTPYMVANIVCLRRPAIKDSSNPSSALFLNLAKLLVAFLQLKEILLCQTSKGLKSKGSSADILFTRKNSHRTGSQLAPLHWPLVPRGVRLCIELQMPTPSSQEPTPPLPSARTSACHLWQPALTFKRLLVGLRYPTNNAFTNKFTPAACHSKGFSHVQVLHLPSDGARELSCGSGSHPRQPLPSTIAISTWWVVVVVLCIHILLVHTLKIDPSNSK